MAGCDYYLCDICECKTFYDSNLYNYDEINSNKNTGHPWPDGDVGDMAVICKDCAKTHRIEIKTIMPSEAQIFNHEQLEPLDE